MMDAPREDRTLPDQRQFDRLADGELDERQRRALLSALDSQPDLWRQCALTLLEAQSWRTEMRWLTQQAAVCTSLDAAAESDAQPRGGIRAAMPRGGTEPPRSGRLLALAAGLLLAFSLGIAARGLLLRNGTDGEPEGRFGKASVAVDASGSATSVPRPPGIRPHVAPVRSTGQDVAEVAPEAIGPVDATPELRGDAITLLVRTGQGALTNRVRVPLVSAKGIGKAGVPPAWLAASQPPLPDRVVQQLEQSGHQVNWQRRYAPVQLDDGRQVVFPVDDIEIAPAVYRPL